jgi:hypothetical protein
MWIFATAVFLVLVFFLYRHPRTTFFVGKPGLGTPPSATDQIRAKAHPKPPRRALIGSSGVGFGRRPLPSRAQS